MAATDHSTENVEQKLCSVFLQCLELKRGFDGEGFGDILRDLEFLFQINILVLLTSLPLTTTVAILGACC